MPIEVAGFGLIAAQNKCLTQDATKREYVILLKKIRNMLIIYFFTDSIQHRFGIYSLISLGEMGNANHVRSLLEILEGSNGRQGEGEDMGHHSFMHHVDNLVGKKLKLL